MTLRALLVLLAGLLALPAAAETRSVTFITDWRAQAEHGGFYQALAEGRYAARGLEVRIVQGGPAVNVPQLLAAGSAEFGIGSNAFIPLNMVQAEAGARAVAAIFQKDPQVLITHPRADVTSIADMRGKPIMVSDATIGAFWVWLRAAYGFEDTQIRKYTFNLAPFLSNPEAIQQGYLSSEPYLIAKEGGFTPQVFLLADAGYPGYANMILARDDLIANSPEVVQAFVDASLEGWISYLTGDPSPGNALILADNPDMDPELIAHAIATINANGLVTAGDAGTLGPGAMTDARWQSFLSVMADQGVYAADLDVSRAYTLQFVNKGPAPAAP